MITTHTHETFWEVGSVRYYPLYFDLKGKTCVVVGGGAVAERKAARLVECGADTVVVSEDLTPELASMEREGKIRRFPDVYRPKYLEDAFIVIGATDRDEVNERVFADARRLGILVNVVDDPARCDFIVPSVVTRDDLVIAVSTGGKSPLLARRIREELEAWYGPEYGTLLSLLGRLRGAIVQGQGDSDDRRKKFESLLDAGLLEYIRKGDWNKVKELVRAITGEEVDMAEYKK